MRRRLLLLSGLAALAGFLFWRRRRPEAAPAGAAPDPAEELRRKLGEVRDRDGTPESPAAGDDEIAAQRRSVHERGRAAADEMRGSGEE